MYRIRDIGIKKEKMKKRLGVNRYAEIKKKSNGIEIMNRNVNRVQVRIP